MKNTKTDQYKKVFYPVSRSVQISRKGILLESPHHMNGKGLPDHLQEVKRGKMGGFSKASKKRMREAILSRDTPEGYISYAVTLTVPGDEPLTPEQCKQLWKTTQGQFTKLGYCGFWRIEVQERGMVHWHLLLCAPPESEWKINSVWMKLLAELPPVMVPVTCYQAEYINNALDWDWDGGKWLEAIDVASGMEDEGFTVDYKQRKHKRCIVLPLRRSLIVGALERACDAVSHEDQSAWLRYINDHCTKSKQAQVLGFGGFRHWGYINKKMLPESVKTMKELSNPEWVTLLRVLSKWTRPRRKADCVFGYKLGFRTSRGRTGASVWFGTSSFYDRALNWAQENPAATKWGEVAADGSPAANHGFWNIYPIASGLQHLISDVKANTRKMLPPVGSSGARRIDSMLPVCSSGFSLSFQPLRTVGAS